MMHQNVMVLAVIACHTLSDPERMIVVYSYRFRLNPIVASISATARSRASLSISITKSSMAVPTGVTVATLIDARGLLGCDRGHIFGDAVSLASA
jgi:hypothetical protein